MGFFALNGVTCTATDNVQYVVRVELQKVDTVNEALTTSDTPLGADDDEDREQREGELVESDAEEVRQRYREHIANTLETTVEELTADGEDYPHPAFGEGLVPADEFYDSKER